MNTTELRDTETAQADTAATPLPCTAAPRTVLIVDDNVDAADALAGILAAWGYETVVAHDGPAALAALLDFAPDIALLDIGMPAMDGYELAAHLRFQPGCEDLPIVAITGLGSPDDEKRSRAKRFAAHLVKPVDPATLAALLRQATAADACVV